MRKPSIGRIVLSEPAELVTAGTWCWPPRA